MGTPLHLAVALDGTGWHPALLARAAGPRGRNALAAVLDRPGQAGRSGLLDFVTIEDGLTLQSDHPFRPDDRTDQVRGRLDAVLDRPRASRLAPDTSGWCPRSSPPTPSRSMRPRPSRHSTT